VLRPVLGRILAKIGPKAVDKTDPKNSSQLFDAFVESTATYDMGT